MQYIGWDTETSKIVKHRKATRNATPSFVCLTWYDGTESGITKNKREAVDLFVGWLEDPETTIIAHNATYDVLVMLRAAREVGVNAWPAVFEAYEDGRVRDTRIREILKDLAIKGFRQGYDLARLEKQYLGRDRSDQKKGDDVWRLRYAELAPWPIDTWPKEAVDYAIGDAIGAYEIFHAQCEQVYSCLNTPMVQDDGVTIVNEMLQTLGDLASSINSSWGMAIDLEKTEEMVDHYQGVMLDLEQGLKDAGLLRPDGVMDSQKKKDLILRGWEAIGEEPTRTPPSSRHPQGQTKTDKKTRQYLGSQGYSDPVFKTWADYDQAKTFLSMYLEPPLDAYPYAVCPYFNILVDTGRLSSSGPNAHNIPARGKGAEIRNCFVPRPGNVLVQCDFSSFEMRTFAQICLNLGFRSRLAEAFQKGIDPHLQFAAEMMSIPYKEAEERKGAGDKEVIDNRSLAKVANFGYPGGLGYVKFVEFALSWGETITLERAKELKENWLRTWPETNLYFQYINAQQSLRHDGKVPIPQHAPYGCIDGWRVRLAPRFTSACNTTFQGLASDGLKMAMWECAKQMHCEPGAPLYGWKLFVNVHDEIIIEGPSGEEDRAAEELSKIMVSVGDIFTPDVPLKAEPQIMYDCWRK